jgi:hypothetical protein
MDADCSHEDAFKRDLVSETTSRSSDCAKANPGAITRTAGRCCLVCHCDLCLNGHTTPLDGPAPKPVVKTDSRRLRKAKSSERQAALLRKQARAIQNRGQQYKRRAERQAARFYDAAHRIDGKGRIRDTRGGRKRLECFDPIERMCSLTEAELNAIEKGKKRKRAGAR